MSLKTRKLSGIAPWPMILLAGPEKVGKTWCAVEACMSPLVTGGLWFPLGENDPDEYALIPGFDHDRFDLVEHDGTYRSLIRALDEALADERETGATRMWVLDSGSMLWELLSQMAYREMHERLVRKAQRQNKAAPEEAEQKPSVDLWNTAAERWGHVIDSFRRHKGPVVITCRVEDKAVMNDNGEPTREKTRKIIAQKTLPSEVDVICELTAPGEAVISGLRSVKLSGVRDGAPFKDFSVQALLERMGVVAGAAARSHSSIDPDDVPAQEADAARAELGALCDERGWDKQAVAAQFVEREGGVQIKEADAPELRAFMQWLGDNWQTVQQGAAA